MLMAQSGLDMNRRSIKFDCKMTNVNNAVMKLKPWRAPFYDGDGFRDNCNLL